MTDVPSLKQDSERMVIGYLAFRIVDADSITCLRIGAGINKEPILVLEIAYKLYNSDISGRLRRLIGLEPGLVACTCFVSCKVPGEKTTKPASVGPR